MRAPSDRKPFFSVVIPTTRPHYLKYSLNSVLAQTFGDFEVIIAFNQVPGGADLGELPNDPRIKVVRASSFLPMHENWENGFRKINGQWALLLGDDDCLIAPALEIAARTLTANSAAQVLLWRWGGFIAPDWPSPERGRLSIPPYSGKVEERSSREIEETLYAFDARRTGEMKKWLPSIMRGAVRSDIVRQAQQRTGYFCFPLTPDYGAAAQIVLLADQVLLLDYPLVILNHPADSMTAAGHGKRETKETQFYGIAGNPKFEYTLVQTRYETNRPLICETLMAVRERYKGKAGAVFDIVAFLEWHYVGLRSAQQLGTDIESALKELHLAIQGLSPEVRDAVGARIKAYDARVETTGSRWQRQLIVLLQQKLSGSRIYEPVLARLARRHGIEIDGPSAGLAEISDFTSLVGRVIGRDLRALPAT
jgi:hypothetical protein